MNDPRAKRVLMIIFILALGFALRHLLTGGVPVKNLHAAPALSGVVAQGLGPTEKNGSLPVAGKDFLLSDTVYFYDRGWAVIKVKPLQKNTDPAYVVLQRVGGEYHLVLGSGTSFSSDFILSLPEDVGNYLSQKGLIYDSV